MSRWHERQPEKIKNKKKFIVGILEEFYTAEPGDGGLQLGRYIAKIKSDKIRYDFIDAIGILRQQSWCNPRWRKFIMSELKTAMEKINRTLKRRSKRFKK